MGLGNAFAWAGGAQGLQQGIGTAIANARLQRQMAMEEQRAADAHNMTTLQYDEAKEEQPFHLAVYKRANGILPDMSPVAQAPTTAPTTAPTATGAPDTTPSAPASSPAIQPPARITSPAATASSGLRAPSPDRMPSGSPPSVGGMVATTGKGQGVPSAMLTDPTLTYGGVSFLNPTGLTYSTLTRMGIPSDEALIGATNPTLVKDLRHTPDGGYSLGPRPTREESVGGFIAQYMHDHPGATPEQANRYGRLMGGENEDWRSDPKQYAQVMGGLIQDRASASQDTFEHNWGYRRDNPLPPRAGAGTGRSGSVLSHISAGNHLADNVIGVYGSADAALGSMSPQEQQMFTDAGFSPDETINYLRAAEARASGKQNAAINRTVGSFMTSGITESPDSARAMAQNIYGGGRQGAAPRQPPQAQQQAAPANAQGGTPTAPTQATRPGALDPRDAKKAQGNDPESAAFRAWLKSPAGRAAQAQQGGAR